MKEVEREKLRAARERIEAARRGLKAQYKSLYTEMVETLARHDPIHLTRIGAPRDEYEFEACEILTRLKETHSPDEVRRLIYQVFVRSFNHGYGADEDPDRDDPKYIGELAGSESSYEEIAHDV